MKLISSVLFTNRGFKPESKFIADRVIINGDVSIDVNRMTPAIRELRFCKITDVLAACRGVIGNTYYKNIVSPSAIEHIIEECPEKYSKAYFSMPFLKTEGRRHLDTSFITETSIKYFLFFNGEKPIMLFMEGTLTDDGFTTTMLHDLVFKVKPIKNNGFCYEVVS